MIAWSVRHRSIVMLIFSIIIITGALIYGDMERQENPTVVAPYAVVKCIYPGASPEDVEKLVVKNLESKIREIEEVKRTESFSMESIGVIKVKLDDISDSKIDKTWEKLKDKVDQCKKDLPKEAYEPEVDTNIVETYGYIATVTSSELEYDRLNEFAQELKGELEKDSGAAKVIVDGEIEDQISINLDMLKLRQYNVTPENIIKILMARNVNIPGGTLDIGDKIKVPVQTTGEYASIDELKNTIIGMSESGNVIYMRDIAKISIEEEQKDIFVKVNGEKALIVGVKYVEGENIVKIGKRLDEIVDDFKSEMPENVDVQVFTDQSRYVDESIKLFQNNLISAVLLVVIVILLTMGVKSSMVVSSSIPAIIMLTFVFMTVFKIQLHQVSIASLIISLSLLVANAIVANDSIYLYLERGYGKEDACIKGVEEVKIPILTSTITTVASFLPLAMMYGTAGKFVKTLPVLVSVALFGSYIASLTLVPAMGYTFFGGEEKSSIGGMKAKFSNNKLIRRITDYFKGIVGVYEKLLVKSIKRPKAVVLSAVVALVASLLLIPALGVQLFPFVERDQYIIDIAVKDGSTSSRTDETVRDIEKILLSQDSVEGVVSKIGDGIPKFYVTYQGNQRASNKAQIIVNGKKEDMHRIQELLEQKVIGARIEVKQLELAEPVGLPVQVRISGEDIGVLRGIAEDVQKQIAQIKQGKNVQDNYGLETYKLMVDVNSEKASMAGLTNYDISSTIRMAINGFEVTKIKPENSDDDIKVIMRIPHEERKTGDVLGQIYFTSRFTGENVPLVEVADIENRFSLNNIMRRDGQRTITVGLYPALGYNAASLLKEVEKKLEGYDVPDGYTMVFGGENEDRGEAFRSLVKPFILAVVVIYMTMVFQFTDLRRPLIIMGTIPLSFIGVIVGLLVTGYPIGFMALLGAISLMGVVVNNGIVLLDYIQVLRDGGKGIDEAVVESCVTRYRPIMVGMITTVIGLVPMAISGGSLWAPMAYSIISGLIVSSALTLFVIPSTYIIFEREGSLIGKLVRYLASRGSIQRKAQN